MKKIVIAIVCAFMITLTSCNCKSCKKKEVVIYTSNEDFRTETVEAVLKKELPDVKVVMQYYSTGTHAAKLKSEGVNTNADIFLDLEVGYAENLKDLFADLTGYDTSNYLDEILPSHHKYHIWGKEAGCVIINNKVLQEKGLSKPTCYEDLLKPEYKGLIMMPNPKTSSTGYYFYNNLYNVWGEEKALSYFENLSKNVKLFSESGSGPVKSIDKGEIAIGLGMTFQAMTYVNNNTDLEVMFFEQGSPYNLYAMGIIKGHEKDENVKKVYGVLYNKAVMEDKRLHNPETIYKNQVPTVIANYPQNVVYAEMKGMFEPSYKEQLLNQWKW